MAIKYFEGIGRRKSSTARVRIMSGSGEFIVNDKPLAEYFTRVGDATNIVEPLERVNQRATLDVSALVKGGGVTGQTGAVRLGVARALLKMNPDLKPALRKAGLLTREAREKERKKPGLKRARKAPTYTKR
ncbi:MAG: 30S ribosomal protein S9 [Chloroflexi bacterium]|nr:30S ribosomal protein S9 [Chloroflexota bacterium]MBU1661184.1 30S ribosomal protein S9 [Chloroflexota bacterium]